MDAERVLVPIVLFVCATLAFKALLEAVIRMRRLMRLGQSETSLRVLLDTDRFQRRAGALRSGIALVALACGAALIEAFGWRDVTPGAVAAVVLPMGIGELLFYFISQRESARTAWRRMVVWCLLAALSSAPALAANAAEEFSGTWSGTFDIHFADGRVVNDTAWLVLQQSGTTVTGSVGPKAEQQGPIRNGFCVRQRTQIRRRQHPGKSVEVRAEARRRQIVRGGARRDRRRQGACRAECRAQRGCSRASAGSAVSRTARARCRLVRFVQQVQ